MAKCSWLDVRQRFPERSQTVRQTGRRRDLNAKYGAQNTNLSFILAIFNRNVGLMVEQVSMVGTVENLMDLPAAADGPLSAESQKGSEALEKLIAGSELPLRIVVSDPGVAARLRSFAAEHPQLGTEVLELPGLPRMQGPPRPSGG